MTFLAKLRAFLADDTGAATVDYVVLTAVIVGLGIAIVGPVRDGHEDVADRIGDTLSNATIACLGENCPTN